MLRKIVTIDAEKCDGCGLCVPSCAEGAITLINGKAVLAADNLCDGLGACLGECPRDAIRIEEREADAFDEDAVDKHLSEMNKGEKPGKHHFKPAMHSHVEGGCPGSRSMTFAASEDKSGGRAGGESAPSRLGQWPVQLHLVSTTAPYFQGADLLITADCVPVAYAGYHEDFLKGKAVVMGCPKLDDNSFYTGKLTELFSRSEIKSVTVLKMEVPCCGGIAIAAKQAIASSGKTIPYKEVTIGIRGEVKDIRQ